MQHIDELFDLASLEKSTVESATLDVLFKMALHSMPHSSNLKQ
jgi:hypothetical protein